MGGCASRPKELDINEPAPVQAPAVEKPESETVAQENNGGEETKTEEPLVDLSETKGEAAESSESKPAEETVEVAAETKAEEKVEAEEKAEAKAEAEPKAEAAPAEVVASETEKTPEPVKEEAKPVEAKNSEDKSDAPLVTM